MMLRETHDCHLGSNKRNVKNIELILNITQSSRLYVVSCSYQWQMQHIWSDSEGHRKFINYMWKIIKFAMVSCGIWRTDLRNLGKFVVENCGPYCAVLGW